jgi:hypothetical protein
MLWVNHVREWTLDSFVNRRVYGNRFPKEFPKPFGNHFPMNVPDEPIVELIARFGPKRAGRYAKLRSHAEFIGELRCNRASYDTIVAILRERHGIEVSDTTVRHFCRELLPGSSGRRTAKRPVAKPISPRPVPAKQVGPQIAEVEFVDDQPDQ